MINMQQKLANYIRGNENITNVEKHNVAQNTSTRFYSP